MVGTMSIRQNAAVAFGWKFIRALHSSLYLFCCYRLNWRWLFLILISPPKQMELWKRLLSLHALTSRKKYSWRGCRPTSYTLVFQKNSAFLFPIFSFVIGSCGGVEWVANLRHHLTKQGRRGGQLRFQTDWKMHHIACYSAVENFRGFQDLHNELQTNQTSKRGFLQLFDFISRIVAV